MDLVAINVVRLPQWTDPAVAEAAGFHSIGDADSGHEHYVHWDWIDDDVWLDPDAPEAGEIYRQPEGRLTLDAHQTGEDGDTYTFDLVVSDAGRSLVEQWRGIALRAVKWPRFQEVLASHRGKIVVLDVWAEY